LTSISIELIAPKTEKTDVTHVGDLPFDVDVSIR